MPTPVLPTSATRACGCRAVGDGAPGAVGALRHLAGGRAVELHETRRNRRRARRLPITGRLVEGCRLPALDPKFKCRRLNWLHRVSISANGSTRFGSGSRPPGTSIRPTRRRCSTAPTRWSSRTASTATSVTSSSPSTARSSHGTRRRERQRVDRRRTGPRALRSGNGENMRLIVPFWKNSVREIALRSRQCIVSYANTQH